MTVTQFPFEFPSVFNLDGDDPQFPITLPFVFGQVKATLAVTATPTAGAGQALGMICQTQIQAGITADAVIATACESNTVVEASASSVASKTVYAESTLGVTGISSGEAFETDRGEGILAVTALPSAEASAGYPSAAEFLAQSSASAEVTRDATADSSSAFIAVPAVFAVNSTQSGSDLQVAATPTVDALRDAVSSSDLTITAEFTSEALETGRGEGFLSVTATVGAEGSVNYPFTALLAVEASAPAEAHRDATVEGNLSAILRSDKYFPFTFPFILGEQLNDMLRDANAVASLDILASISLIISQNIVGYLNVIVEGSGTGYLYAPVDDVPTVVEAGLSADGANLSRAQSSTEVDAQTSSTVFKDAGVEAYLTVQCAISADLRNDAVVDSSFGAEASATAIGVENDAAASESSFTATLDADSLRDARALVALQADVSISADPWRETYADGVSTAILAAPTGVAAVPLKISDLSDYFNTKDETKWDFNGADVEGGALIVPAGGSVESKYSASAGSPWWKFTDGCVVNAQLPQTPNIGDGTTVTAFEIREVGCGPGRVRVAWQNGVWSFAQMGSSGSWGDITSAPYDSAGSWIRLTNMAGTVIWETSPDGITWTVQASETLQGSYVGCSAAMWSEAGSEESPGEAHWDNFNIIPVMIDAGLSLTHSSAGSGTSEKYADSYLTVDADTFQAGSNNANAVGALAAYMYSDQYLMKTLNASVTLDISAESDSRGTEYNPANADFAATIEGSAELSRGQDFAALLDTLFDSDSSLQRGQFVETPFLDISFSTGGSGANNASAHADLSMHAFSDADSVRIQYLAAELAATVESIVSSIETGYADALTDITAQLTASMSRNQTLSAMLESQTQAFTTAVRVYYTGAALAATAYATGEVEEPREVVHVEADNRIAAVATESRLAGVGVEMRRADVPADTTTRSVLVKVDVRIAAVGKDSTRVTGVKAENRVVPVPAELLQATI